MMRALYVTSDLLFSSRVSQAARQVGVELQLVASTEAALGELVADETALVMLDLGSISTSLKEFVDNLRARSESLTILAYGPHVDEDALAAARSAGCDLVLTRGQFDREIKQILAELVA